MTELGEPLVNNDNKQFHPSKGEETRFGSLLLVLSVTVALVTLAVVLALTAVPSDNAIAKRGTKLLPDSGMRPAQPILTSTRPRNTDADTSVKIADTEVANVRNAYAIDEALLKRPLFGPPERVLTAAETAIQSLLLPRGSEKEVASVKTALAAVRARRARDALQGLGALSSPGARKLVQWYAFRSFGAGVSPQSIETFRMANPRWPEQDLLRRRAEQSLFLGAERAENIRAFFAKSEPQFPSGKAAMATAELQDGQTEVARKRIVDVWRTGEFNLSVENRILRHFKPLLSQDDFIWRMNRFLLDDDRYGRPRRLASIRRMIDLLDADEAEKARARLLVWRSYGRRGRKRRIASALSAFAAIETRKNAAKITLPVRKPNLTNASLKSDVTIKTEAGAIEETSTGTNSPRNEDAKSKPDWPLQYHRIQILRRQGKDGEAWRKLIDAPTATDLIAHPDGWWVERRTNAYNALYRASPRTAYRLVSRTGKLSVNARNEALFMAGWIALRKLNDPEAARRHFSDFVQSADGPRTRSQAHYWLARTFMILNEDERAKTHLETAAKEFGTFYGQLARQSLQPDLRHLHIPKASKLTQKHIEEFKSRDEIQALRFAHLAGHQDATRRLLRALSKSTKEPHILHLLAEFAKSTGDTQMSVRIGKRALFHGVNLAEYAYPTHAFPSFQPLRSPPELAMLYGLARQESEFNTLITSIAGARGVLQVMPMTARDVCRNYKLRCGSRSALTRKLSQDPSYNATLASAYISDRQDEFGGSYILTFAGYNAGPGRARYWIRKIGDPRDPKVDPIDWIESIHIKETRDYVKKVLANLQIYRARLDDPQTALRITTDINRGTF